MLSWILQSTRHTNGYLSLHMKYEIYIFIVKMFHVKHSILISQGLISPSSAAYQTFSNSRGCDILKEKGEL